MTRLRTLRIYPRDGKGATESTQRYVVLVVSEYVPTRGGTTTQTRLQAREFVRAGRNVVVLTRRLPGLASRQRIDGADVRRVGFPGRGRAAKMAGLATCWLWLIRRRTRIDGVSIMLDSDFAIVARLARLRDRTIMTWVTRGDATRLLGGRAGPLRRLLLAGVRHVVLTPKMAHELHDLGIHDVSIIPVPVDTSQFLVPTRQERLEARRRLALGSQRVVLFVGHLQRRKAVDRLLDAFNRLEEGPDGLVLFVVGGPVEKRDLPYVKGLQNIASRANLRGRVTLWGPRDDVRSFLYASDIFCLPSHREGMPNVLLEAMACGLPCVAPPSAGGDELLRPGVGVVPASNAPDCLADALAYLLDHTEERIAMGLQAAEVVQLENQPAHIAECYEQLWTGGLSTAVRGTVGPNSVTATRSRLRRMRRDEKLN